jgi:DNA repair protein MmcB-like
MSSEPLALPPETARIARGVRRLLRARGFSRVMELPLVDGWRADIVAVNGEDQVLIVEIQLENITSAAGGAMQPAGGDLSEAQELRLRHAEAMRP